MTLTVPCLFGLESLVADEMRRLDLKNVQAENGRVHCEGTLADIARLNINLRCGARVLMELGSFPARDFEALFQGVYALPWEDYIPRDGEFPVKGYSLNSQLHSVPACQSIVKKASAKRLGEKYGVETLPESGSRYQIQFSIIKDVATLYLDTSGEGLYKRGYRAKNMGAPLRETLAAALVTLSRYRGKDPFCDPFCGSGTIAIEAALAAKGRAPGLSRHFAAEGWANIPAAVWDAERESARAREYNGEYRIYASDIDPEAVAIARANARRAGVGDLIEFSVADARRFRRGTDDGVIVTNPPYGERLMERRSAQELLGAFGEAWRGTDWRLALLSSDEEAERLLGRRADKRRKLYNGMIKCTLYIYGVRKPSKAGNVNR